MEMNVENPLMVSELEGAAYLCLATAATVDFDQFPPGSGWLNWRALHARKCRFEGAATKVRGGSVSLVELGILPEDCKWAASMAKFWEDPEQWHLHFQAAENSLRDANKT